MTEPVFPAGEISFSDKAPTGRATAQGQTDTSPKLEQACKDFESLFVNQMMKQMRKTVPQEGLFNGGRAEKIYTEMLDSELAKSISNQRGLGLATMMYRQMSTLASEEKSGESK